jgi:hypothetical protein
MEKININNQQLIKNGFVGHMLRMTAVILFRTFQVTALLVLLGLVCFVVYTGNLNVSNLAALIIIIWIMWEFFIG